MWKVLQRARGSYARDQRGNVAVLFAFSAIPLIGILGGAVDMARHVRYKTQVLNAMDSAVVALVRHGAKNDKEADAFVNSYIAALVPSYLAPSGDRRQAPARDPMVHLAPFNATEVEGGYRVTSDGYMETAFMPLVGITEMPLDLTAEAVMSTTKYEVALALDNTGSMAERNKIGDLREAAGDLVDMLYEKEGAEDLVKMALVPFVTSVNIKGDAFKEEWIDRSGKGKYADDLFDRPFDRVAYAERLGFGWKGCVEAREEDDLGDAAPDSLETKWVPHFWPDEPDRGDYNNSYLVDRGGRSDWDKLRNTAKYDAPIWEAGGRRSLGPNKGCGGPIVELTSNTRRLHDAIDDMAPNHASGTNIAQGLVWGWRVLSPGEPFTQGVSYDDEGTQKALVLMSDGYNQIVDTGSVLQSHYTGYGYLAQNRLGTTNDGRRAEQAVNAKVAELCRSVKGTNIRLYMILFQVNDRKTQQIFEDCASTSKTGEKLYYYAPNGEALKRAFLDIGEDLTSLSISR